MHVFAIRCYVTLKFVFCTFKMLKLSAHVKKIKWNSGCKNLHGLAKTCSTSAKYSAMGGAYANYFRFRLRDVIRSHHRATWRDWLQQEIIMLMTLQVSASYVQTFDLARATCLILWSYLLLALISFLYFKINPLRQIISRSTGPILTKCSPYRRYFGRRLLFWPSFFDRSRDVAMATNFKAKSAKLA